MKIDIKKEKNENEVRNKMRSKNKLLEYVFIVHILILIFCIALLKQNFNIDVIEYTSNFIEKIKQVTLNDFEVAILDIESNPKIYNMTKTEITEYKIYSKQLIEQFYYYMYYFMPAIVLLLILGVVVIEVCVYKKIKLSHVRLRYINQRENLKKDAENKDIKKERSELLHSLLKQEVDAYLNELHMPSHVPVMCMIIYLISAIDLTNQLILKRVLENIQFGLIVILTIYGIKVATKIFRTRNKSVKLIVAISNIILAFMVPQMYFIIGFLTSLFKTRIVIQKI